MLKDQEKRKIRLEETYRQEVREVLSKKESKRSFLCKVAHFFNSAFGLWLLSAIFITGGVKLYEDYKSGQEDKRNTNEEIDKLNLEIGYRYSHVITELYKLTLDSVADPVETRGDEIKRVALSIGNSKGFIYQEYADWGLLSLMAEEKRLMQHLGKNTEHIERVIGHVSELKVFYEVRKVDFASADQVAGYIQEDMWLPEWKQGGFYYSEGSMEMPFP